MPARPSDADSVRQAPVRAAPAVPKSELARTRENGTAAPSTAVPQTSPRRNPFGTPNPFGTGYDVPRATTLVVAAENFRGGPATPFSRSSQRVVCGGRGGHAARGFGLAGGHGVRHGRSGFERPPAQGVLPADPLQSCQGGTETRQEPLGTLLIVSRGVHRTLERPTRRRPGVAVSRKRQRMACGQPATHGAPGGPASERRNAQRTVAPSTADRRGPWVGSRRAEWCCGPATTTCHRQACSGLDAGRARQARRPKNRRRRSAPQLIAAPDEASGAG